jgi:hypothetical protein
VVADIILRGRATSERKTWPLCDSRIESTREVHCSTSATKSPVVGASRSRRNVDRRQALCDERPSGTPPPVDRLLADPGFLGDPLDGELVIAHLLEHLRRCGEDGVAGRGTADRTGAVLVHGSRLTPSESDETVRMI